MLTSRRKAMGVIRKGCPRTISANLRGNFPLDPARGNAMLGALKMTRSTAASESADHLPVECIAVAIAATGYLGFVTQQQAGGCSAHLKVVF